MPTSHSRSAATKPPTTAAPLAIGLILSATAFEVVVVPPALALAVPELVGAAPEEAAEELAAGTSEAMRLPQVWQALEPGFWVRHWAKVAWQM